MIVKPICTAAMCGMLFFACAKDYVSEQEPNDSFAQAMPVEPGKDIRGFLQTITDRDFYRITVETDSILDVGVSGVKGINTAIRLWEEKAGEGMRLLKIIDDNRKSAPERFPNLYVRRGTYFIEITHGGKDIKTASTEDYYTLTCKLRDAGNEEMEPNDNQEQATLLLPGTEMTGYYAPSYNRSNTDKDNLNREEDWYVIDVEMNSEAPVLLDLLLSGVPGINAEIYLYDENKKEIARADNGQRGSGEEIRGIGIKETGKYYVMITCKNYESNNDDPYTLTALIKESDPSGEMEPNNDIETANVIINNQISGIIGQKGDVDFFCYKPVNDFGIYRINLDPDGSDDFIVSVYGTKKNKLFDINNGGNGVPEIYPDFKSTGEFYCSVSSRSAGTGKYTLSITPLDDVADLELEPNDTKGEATKFSGSRAIGFISHKGDKDFYLLEYDARVNAVFDITGVKRGEIKASITDPLGYIIRTEQIKGEKSVKMKDMIDKKGYLIIEPVTENYENPYKIIMRIVE